MAFVPSEYSYGNTLTDALDWAAAKDKAAKDYLRGRASSAVDTATAPARAIVATGQRELAAAEAAALAAKEAAEKFAYWTPRLLGGLALAGGLYWVSRPKGGRRNPWDPVKKRYTYGGKLGEYIAYSQGLAPTGAEAKDALVQVFRMFGLPL